MSNGRFGRPPRKRLACKPWRGFPTKQLIPLLLLLLTQLRPLQLVAMVKLALILLPLFVGSMWWCLPPTVVVLPLPQRAVIAAAAVIIVLVAVAWGALSRRLTSFCCGLRGRARRI
jgi:hypothetical protein